MFSTKTMKAAFEILKDRPKVSVVLTRDSVCAGDDCDAPHEKKIEVHSFLDPLTFVTAVSSGYLPSIAGVGHTWTCTLNGKGIAEIAVTNTKALIREIPFEEKNCVHFIYHSARY